LILAGSAASCGICGWNFCPPAVAHPEPAVRLVATSAAGTVGFSAVLVLSLQCGSWRHLLLKTFALPAVLARHFVI
jgi:hypothetical protein